MGNTKPLRKPKFDSQFKQEAVRQVQQGRSVASVAQALKIASVTLYRWVEMAQHPTPTQDKELARLRKQLRQVETERDILKKVLFILNPNASNSTSL